MKKPRKKIVIQRKQIENVTFQLEGVRCGKPTCKRCPHGPYWYAYFWCPKLQRTRTKYIGKRPPWEQPKAKPKTRKRGKTSEGGQRVKAKRRTPLESQSASKS